MMVQTPVLEVSTKPVTHSLTRTNQEPLPAMDCALQDTRVRTLVIRQGQDLESEQPLISGRNLADWWSQNDASDDGGPVIAWTGQNAEATKAGCHLRLFKVTWENPQPELPVESFTFRSELTYSAPFLLAVTAEP